MTSVTSRFPQMEVASGCKESGQKLEMYASYREKFPRAHAPQRLPLDIAEGAEFRSLADRYLRKALSKGVPPLFVDLRPLYADAAKVRCLEELCLGYLDGLRGARKCYDPSEDSPVREPATAELWVMYYLAQHFDHLGDYARALTLVEEAIDHTPTLIELFLLKGKIFKVRTEQILSPGRSLDAGLKINVVFFICLSSSPPPRLQHVGNLDEAVKWMDEAQSLDTADRYINCKCAKYMLRANQVRIGLARKCTLS